VSSDLDNFFGFVEGFEDQELRRRIFARDPYSPKVPRIQHCKCPHCGQDVFIRSGESGFLELVTEFDPDRDGSDRVFDTDVIPHECDEPDLFDDLPPF
jgi:hypothetical protein